MQGLDISLFIFFYVAYPFAKNKYLQAFCFGINNTPRYAKCHEQRVEGEHSQFADTLAQELSHILLKCLRMILFALLLICPTDEC